MKTLNLTFAIFAISSQVLFGQYNRNSEKTTYGFEVNQFASASGFKTGTEAHFTVRPSMRAQVGFGVYFDNETQRLSGVTITHKRMLRSYKRNNLPVFEPMFFYNFIYRKSLMPELLADGTTGSFASYTSMEHHIGLGFNLNVFSNFFLQGEAGYGLFLGSIKKPSSPDPITNEISGSNGWGSILKLGVGFRI